VQLTNEQERSIIPQHRKHLWQSQPSSCGLCALCVTG